MCLLFGSIKFTKNYQQINHTMPIIAITEVSKDLEQ